MSGFDAGWLDLREPADQRARSLKLAGWLATDGSRTEPLAITDLGGGTGANLRWLAPQLARSQDWCIIDHDPALIAAQSSRLATWAEARGGSIRKHHSDNSLQIDGAGPALTVRAEVLDLSGSLELCPLTHGGIVTCSALLDLVSEPWLERLSRRMAEVQAAGLFALTYDGRIDLTPSLPADDTIRTLVNRHQRREKGFGPALGPTAAAVAARCLLTRGFRVEAEASDWRIDSDEPALLHALIAGWVSAASAIEPDAGPALTAWQRERQSQIGAGTLSVTVGHQDLIAFPAG